MREMNANDRARVRLVSSGVALDADTVVPLLAGAVHYWRLPTAAWRPALEAVKALGFRLVDVYVPWGVHETAPGEFDLGQGDPRLDVTRFLRLIGELELYAIVRPGPHINAELTWFGLPERVVWDSACQALSAGRKPVVLPVPPLAFPVPSYASEAFHTEVEQWFSAIGAALSPFRYPDGPIVLLQVDNEGAMYFRDGVYDQDYHPDAIARYRHFLQNKYARVDELRRVYGDPALTFAQIEPPRRLSASVASELAPHLDWADFQEELLADAFQRMQGALRRSGLDGLPTSHNLPISEGATPLDPARIAGVVDLLGLDYYHAASAPQRSEIARRTSELATRCAASGTPPFACELGAGFPPFYPPLGQDDNAFTVLAALAYGLRGFNAYMAVERDRWIGAPIDPHGRRRPSATFWERLLAALERTHFAELERRAEVRIAIPRSMRRLARVLHAFGPLSAALVQVAGGGAREGCYEDDLGLGGPVIIEAEQLVRQLEDALERRRIPYAFIGGDLIDAAIDAASWVVVPCTGALEPEITRSVMRGIERGRAVSLGPRAPTRDATMLPLDAPPALPEQAGGVPVLLDGGRDHVERAVDRAAQLLGLTSLPAEPASISVTLHHDARGAAAVLFVLNPTEQDVDARVTCAGARSAIDALDGERFAAQGTRFALRVKRRSVRMLELLD